MLTELQTLRTSHNQNFNSPEINPFTPEGPSHPHTSRSLISSSQPPHHLKLSFPRFDGNVPTGWVYKAEQYFDFKDITPTQQVQLASFHLDGIALQWHRWLNKFHGPLTWSEFVKAMLLLFGPTEYEDPSKSLTRLRQTTTMAAYQDAFERLSHQVDGLPESFLIGCFVAGLRDDVRIEVKIKQPHTLADAIGVARLIEERNLLQKKPNPLARSSPIMMTTKAPANPTVGILDHHHLNGQILLHHGFIESQVKL